jgi:hypothetical protein
VRALAVASTLACTVAMLAAQAGAQVPTEHPGTVVVRGVPLSYQVADVPVPGALRACRDIAYEITATPLVRILTAVRGTVPQPKASLLVTMSIAGNAQPGRSTAATVLFSAGCAPSAATIIAVDVDRVHAIVIAPDSGRTVANAGEDLTLRVTVSNNGNAPDAFELRALVPPRWSVEGPRTITLERGQSVQRTFRIEVPAGIDGGTAVIGLMAVAGTDTLATSRSTFTVVGSRSRASIGGPLLTLGAGAGRMPDGTIGSAFRFKVDGRLTEDLRITGELPIRSRASAADQALIGVGYWRPVPRLTLEAPSWRLGLGQTGGRFPETTGAALYGRGVTFDLRQQGWHLSTFAAQPSVGGGGGAGTLAAASIDRRYGAVLVGLSGAHLAERTFRERQLDAVAARAAMDVPNAGSVVAELGHRRFASGSGLAWLTEFQRHGETGTVIARAAMTPGGTNAFARAADEFSLYAYQSFRARSALGVSGWLTRDSSASWSHLTNEGLSLHPSVGIGRGFTLGADALRSRYVGEGSAGRIDNGESALGALIDFRRGSLDVNASATSRRLTRSLATAGGLRSDLSIPRAQYGGTVSVDGRLGRAQSYVSLDRGEALGGLPPEYLTYGLRLDRVAPIPRLRTLFLSGQIGYSRLADLPTRQSIRLTANSQLPGATRLKVYAERSPFAIVRGGRTGWMYAVALEHDVGMPRLPSRPYGVVYRDENGNGLRDEMEEGIAGVVVSGGGMTAVTDRKGRYRFSRRPRGSVKVDNGSIPAQLIVPPTTRADSARHDIGLLGVATVTVRLVVTEGDRPRVDSIDLAAVRVIARDSAGRSWVSRTVRAGEVALEGLPPGRYALSIDASASREPLFVEGTVSELTILNRQTPAVVTIMLRARTLKIRQFPSSPPQ